MVKNIIRASNGSIKPNRRQLNSIEGRTGAVIARHVRERGINLTCYSTIPSSSLIVYASLHLQYISRVNSWGLWKELVTATSVTSFPMLTWMHVSLNVSSLTDSLASVWRAYPAVVH